MKDFRGVKGNSCIYNVITAAHKDIRHSYESWNPWIYSRNRSSIMGFQKIEIDHEVFTERV
jgi:hypothetical protein